VASSPGEEEHVGAPTKGEGKLAERAGVAGKLQVPAGERVPSGVVPEVVGHDTGQPQPTKLVLRGRLPLEGAQGTPQNGKPCRISLAEVRGETVQ
jgi:hypothetical protein